MKHLFLTLSIALLSTVGWSQCNASFTTSVNGNTVSIFNTSASSNNNTYWSWTMTGGSPSSGTTYDTTSTLSTNYNAPGGYVICVIQYDSGWACVDTFCDSVYIFGSTLNASASVSSNDSCGACNGVASASASGGVSPYSYTWSNGGNTQPITGLCAGNYGVTVQDSNGDTVQAGVTVISISTVALSLTSTNETCASCCNGTASASVSGGSGGYDYSWSNSAGNVSSQSSLCPGTYSVTVTDTIFGCSTSGSTTVSAFTTSCYNVSGEIAQGEYTRVYLIEENSGVLSAVDSTQTDSLGNYNFSNICNGLYYVKGALLPAHSGYANHIPTYYDSAAVWSGATAIVVAASSIYNVDFSLLVGSNAGGAGFVGGAISQGANRGEGDPVAGVFVIVYNENGSVAAFDKTDANGEYAISNLSFGTYTVHVDVLNKTSYPHLLTLSTETPSSSDRNFEVIGNVIKPIAPLGVSELEKGAFTVYPNPTNGQLFINAGEQMMNQVSVINLIGERVLVQKINKTGMVELNLNELAKGAYMLEMTGESFTQHQSIIVK